MVRTSPRTRLVRIPGPAHYAHAINVVRLVYHRAVKLFRISRSDGPVRSELYTDPCGGEYIALAAHAEARRDQ